MSYNYSYDKKSISNPEYGAGETPVEDNEPYT
jgi:hypothetical protein